MEFPRLTIVTDTRVEQCIDQRLLKRSQWRGNGARTQPEHARSPKLPHLVEDNMARPESEPGRHRADFGNELRRLHTQECKSYMEVLRLCRAAFSVDRALKLRNCLPDRSIRHQGEK